MQVEYEGKMIKTKSVALNGKLRTWVVVALSVLIGCLASVETVGQGVDEILVHRVQLETSTNLTIQARAVSGRLPKGQNLTLTVSIKNQGSRPVFLVKKAAPEIVNKGGDVLISAPWPAPENKFEYDFTFQKIMPRATHEEHLVIPWDTVQSERDLRISIGLGFVTDVSGIDRRLEIGDDPVALRGVLMSRMEVVGIGSLRVLFENSK